MAMNGALSGLVAVTSGCAYLEPYAAIVTGIVAGWLYMLSSALLIKLRIDDAVNAIPVHMVNGFWGLIATGLFASPRLLTLTHGDAIHPGFFYSFGNGGADGNLLLCQFCAALFILGWTFVTMFPFFIWLNYRYVPIQTFCFSFLIFFFSHNLSVSLTIALSLFPALIDRGWLRADSLEELVGLDVSYHGRSTHGENGDIKKEYIEAYNRYKETIRKGSSNHGHNNSNPDQERLSFPDSHHNIGRPLALSTSDPPNHTIQRSDQGDKHTVETSTTNKDSKEDLAH